jgi:hypothetical protein
MPLLNLADVLVQVALKLRSIGFESGVMRSQKKSNATVMINDFEKIVCAEQNLNSLVADLTISFHHNGSYLRHSCSFNSWLLKLKPMAVLGAVFSSPSRVNAARESHCIVAINLA